MSTALNNNAGAPWEGVRQAFGKQSDLLLVAAIVGILLVLFIPIPPGLLDFLLIANVHFALLILLITFYVEKPLQFSTFPTLLLIATLFRLSLNIAATRLILTDAHAGQVISTIGSYVVGGNYIIGLIVFLVLIVVQYVVVTNGAQRVAEVAARFTLDGMPGKQMSIDADLNMGLIDDKEAQIRRKQIEKEANFYGAMDGSSKFVKGDAIAGILIILINIIGGLTIGVAQRDMAWGEALQTFTLLTIGDGIVTQIPALIISTGTGIIVTRAASDAFLSKEIGHQITAFPKILLLVGLSLSFILLLPGTPAVPTLVALAIVAGLFWFAMKAKKHRQEQEKTHDASKDSNADGENVYDMLAVEAFEVRVGQALIPLFNDKDGAVMTRIKSLRKQFALESGFVMPWLRAKDDKKLESQKYEIYIYGSKVGEGELLSDRILAIDPGRAAARLDGVQTRDPTYNLPAWWITENQSVFAAESGYTVVEPINVLLTHLSEILRKRSHSLLSRAETQRLLDRVKKTDVNLVDDLIPGVISLGVLQKVLQNLLREGVSIRNLETILEALADAGTSTKDPDYLTEIVRRDLGGAICQAAGESELQVLVLDQIVEQNIIKSLRPGEKPKLVLEPGFAEKIITRLANYSERMLNSSINPILLCAPELRRHIRSLTERMIPDLKVVALSEVPANLSVRPFAIVSLDERKALEP